MPDYLAGWREQMLQATQVAQGIRQAAMQQQELDETKRSNAFSQALRGREVDLAVAAQAQKTQHDNLVDQLSALNSGGTGVTTGDDGNNYVAGPAAGTPGAGPTVPGAVGVTQQMTAPPVNPGRVVSAGGQRMYIPTADEAASANLTRSLQARRAELAQTEMPLPDAVQSELYPNASGPMNVQPGAMPAMSQLYQDQTNRKVSADARATAANAKTAPPPEEVSHVVQSYGKGGTYVTPVFKSGKVGDTILRPGGPAGEMRGGDGGAPKPATPGQFAAVEKDKASALSKSQEDLQKDLAGAQKQYTQDDTFDRAGAIRQAYANHYARLQQAQLTYEARYSELRGSDVGHNPWADIAAAGAAGFNAGHKAGSEATAAPAQQPVAAAAPAAAAPGAPAQPAAGATVRVKNGAGQVGTLPAANLKKAQALDPKLQVLQ